MKSYYTRFNHRMHAVHHLPYLFILFPRLTGRARSYPSDTHKRGAPTEIRPRRAQVPDGRRVRPALQRPRVPPG
jgi:hypothetical protein